MNKDIRVGTVFVDTHKYKYFVTELKENSVVSIRIEDVYTYNLENSLTYGFYEHEVLEGMKLIDKWLVGEV